MKKRTFSKIKIALVLCLGLSPAFSSQQQIDDLAYFSKSIEESFSSGDLGMVKDRLQKMYNIISKGEEDPKTKEGFAAYQEAMNGYADKYFTRVLAPVADAISSAMAGENYKKTGMGPFGQILSDLEYLAADNSIPPTARMILKDSQVVSVQSVREMLGRLKALSDEIEKGGQKRNQEIAEKNKKEWETLKADPKTALAQFLKKYGDIPRLDDFSNARQWILIRPEAQGGVKGKMWHYFSRDNGKEVKSEFRPD